MKKVLITATVGRFFGFEKNDIEILKRLGYEVHVATNMLGDIDSMEGFDVIKHQIDYSRSPFSKDVFKAYGQIKRLIRKENFELVYCHTPVAGILARIAARPLRKVGTRVIYTAHGFHFYKGAPLKNWLMYFPAEWFCSCFTDLLITINKEDYERAKKRLRAKKTVYVPGVGVDVAKIQRVRVDREEKRKELGIGPEDILLLSVGECNVNKNHRVVIEALRDMTYNVKYLIAGSGSILPELEALVENLGLTDRVSLLGFRTDVPELLKACDIYVLPSLREGLNVSLMEAMAAGCPCLVGKIRGNVDLIDEGQGGYLFDPKDVNSVRNALVQAVSEDVKASLSAMGDYNRKKIKQFSIEEVSKQMEEIFRECV